MMKTFKFYSTRLLAAAAVCLLCLACSDSDNSDPTPPNPLETAHFDIWVSIGGTSGMGSENTQLVQSTKTLHDSSVVVDFRGTGADVTAKLYQEAIIKGQYYYQIPKEKDRFGKYRVGTSGVETVREVSFGANTYKDRRYTHAWISDNTFVVIAANGDSDRVLWTKINADNMTIVAEGTLALDPLSKYSTSGIASYRATDNKILYSYCHGTSNQRTQFYMAFINPADMSVEKTVTENRAEFMAGTAYGELLQSKSFFDVNGDYYLACSTVIAGAPSSTQQFGTLLRIKKGETNFDPNYTGFRSAANQRGKIITAEFLTDGKALLYIQDPEYTGAAGWGSDYNCYYAVLNLATNQLEALNLPFSEGLFSQRSAVLGDKAYIGVNPKNGEPCVYVYDIATGKLTKGLKIAEGYAFDRIVTLLD
jgi:hypothetical protein